MERPSAVFFTDREHGEQKKSAPLAKERQANASACESRVDVGAKHVSPLPRPYESIDRFKRMSQLIAFFEVRGARHRNGWGDSANVKNNASPHSERMTEMNGLNAWRGAVFF